MKKSKFFRTLSVILAVLMVALMVPAMSASAATRTMVLPAADGEDTVYYLVYKVASAEVVSGQAEDSEKSSWTYSVEQNIETLRADKGILKYGSVTVDETLDAKTRAKMVKALIKDVSDGTAVTAVNSTENNDKGTKAGETVSDLTPGYYLLVPSFDGAAPSDKFYGALLVPVTYKDIAAGDLEAKVGTITLDKTITKVEDNSKSADIGNNNHTATVGANSEVTYEITTQFPSYLSGIDKIKNFVLADTPATGIKIKDESAVKVSVADVASVQKDTDYSIEMGNPTGGFTITFADAFVLAHPGKAVTVTVEATIDDETSYSSSLENKAKLNYDNNYYSSVDTDDDDNKSGDGEKESSATVYQTEIDVSKKFDGITDNGSTPEAQFTLSNSDIGYSETITITEDMWNASSASFKFSFKGLQVGTYTLSESKTPDGYKKANDITIEITAEEEGSTYTYSYNSGSSNEIGITNEKGTTLPGTGGMGTYIFTGAGIAIVLLAGVMLAVYMRKRKSED